MITLEMMPPLMFGGLILAMLIGFPVAFTLAALGLSFGFLSIYLGFFDMNFLQAIPGRIFGSVLSNELLLAIPFFTFMGSVLERCGLAEDMLNSMGQLFGPVRGGLGYSVIIVGFILGAITGTVAAQVIAMALISLPVMLRYGYNVRYITGVLAASGTITQLVPPSLVLIVMADQLGKSVGDMYLGAWGPSVLQIALFAGYTFLLGIFKPSHVPAVPKEARTLTGWPLWRKCLMGIIPSAVLIFVVLGTMMLGLATPTEAGAMGAIGAIVLAAIHHKELSSKGHKMLLIGIAAAGVGTIIGVLLGEGKLFKLDLRGGLSRRRLALPRGRPHPRPARPDQAGLPVDHAPHHHGGLHPDRIDLLLGGVPRRLRRRLARAPSDIASRRRLGLPDLHQSLHLLPGVLPRLLRDRLHHPADGCADCAEGTGASGGAGCGVDLVRRHALRQHADLVPASAVRLCAVLFARRCAEGSKELRHLLGRHTLDRPAGDHGRDRDRLPDHVTALLDKPLDVDLSKVRIEVPQIELPPIDFGQPKQ